MPQTQAKTIRELTYREMIPDTLWDRLTHRLMDDENVSHMLAELIMNEALGFLKVCADHPGHGFSPSLLVDKGWHTFILYTRPYRDFCEKYAGRFIHHSPNDKPDEGESSSSGLTAMETYQLMEDHGYTVNLMLWVDLSPVLDCMVNPKPEPGPPSADRCAEPCDDRCQARCEECETCEHNSCDDL